MEQIYHGQLYLFILSIMSLSTDIKAMDSFSHDWFDAQKQCFGQGLTTEKNKSQKPYWTGVYRRLTPWINIIGCYSDFFDSLPGFVEKTMMKSSVGICQEMCYRENGYVFAVKMNDCLCIESDTLDNLPNKVPSINCTYTCEDHSDDVYLGGCGGEKAYNVYAVQGVTFDSMELCLSLQCTDKDKRFIPKKCTISYDRVCENMRAPDIGYASSWNLSMIQCKNSQPSYYLLGDVNLTDPYDACNLLNHEFHVVWIGVARQVYTSIDKGRKINKEQREKFMECQMCGRNNCRFRHCSDSLNGFIYCKSDTSQSSITEDVTTLQGFVSTFNSISNQSTTTQLFASTYTAVNYDKDQFSSVNDTLQKTGSSDDLVLKISLPLALSFIVLSMMSAVGVVFLKRRKKMTKTARTSREGGDSVHTTNVHFDSNYIQDNSYFVLEQCSQKISKGSNSLNESPYNESEEGVYDLLRDKQARSPEMEDTYQHASAGESTDLSEYDTMANAQDKKQEEESSYEYTLTDKNKNYRTDLRAQNHFIDSPYVAV